VGTKRTPIKRQPESKITPQAIRLFNQMMRIRCTCAPGQRFECSGCRRWEKLDEELGVEMKVPVWRLGRTITNPEGTNPYPVGSYAHRTWQPDHEGRALWLQLAAASRDARREARRAKAAARKAATVPTAQPEPLPTP
jgi:hypothetical protein